MPPSYKCIVLIEAKPPHAEPHFICYLSDHVFRWTNSHPRGTPVQSSSCTVVAVPWAPSAGSKYGVRGNSIIESKIGPAVACLWYLPRHNDVRAGMFSCVIRC